jgi:hypothetical protein
MESRNEKYRNAVYRAESDSKDMDKKEELEEVNNSVYPETEFTAIPSSNGKVQG